MGRQQMYDITADIESEQNRKLKQLSNMNTTGSNPPGEETQKKEEVKKPVGIVLPTVKQVPTTVNPRTLVISGKHKVGKTSILSQLPNCLLVDVEDGSAYYEGLVMKCPEGYGPVSKFKWLQELAKTIKDAGKPYDYVAIDTISQLDIDSEWYGTWLYMNSVTGKKFNRKVDGNGDLMKDKDGKTIMLKPSDDEYESVLSLGQGYGYKWTRQAMMDIYDTLKDVGKVCTIFISHVADKMIAEKSGEQVMVKDLALTGKVRDLIPRLVDGIATVWNEDGEVMISFVANEDKIGGIRCKHLRGYSGKLEWNKIFITDTATK